MRKSIRGGMGLGDALYVQSVARHLIEKGESLRVHSAWPAVFTPLGDKAEVVPFSRKNVQILAHYPTRKGRPETSQFEDCCITAGIKEKVDLRLDWALTNRPLVESVTAHGGPIVCVQLPRTPMGRTDGFGLEILPDCRVIQKMIDRLRDRALIVQIGSGKPLFAFTGIDIDLANKTSVQDLLDVASVADGFLGYPSFVVPMAESLCKPALLVWSRKGLNAGHVYIRQITPEKVCHKRTSKHVVDDWSPGLIQEAVDGFL